MAFVKLLEEQPSGTLLPLIYGQVLHTEEATRLASCFLRWEVEQVGRLAVLHDVASSAISLRSLDGGQWAAAKLYFCHAQNAGWLFVADDAG